MKSILRRAVMISAVAVIVGSSLGLALPALVQKASAAGCVAPSLMFGRWKWCGYFYNRFEDSGDNVRLAGVPSSINTVGEFVQLIKDDYNSGNTQKITEAVFVVRTMTEQPLPTPPCGLGTCKTLSPGDFTELAARLSGYSSSGENGSQSFGPNGHIDWFHSDYMHCGDVNSYYQNTYHDIAPYIISKSNDSDCDKAGVRFDHIIIYDGSGNVLWKIRRLCMNPLGTIKPLAPKPLEYNLAPNVVPSQNGSPLPNGSYIDAGSTLRFDYSVNNLQSDTATGIACNMYANTFSGFRAIPTPATSSGPPPSGPTCTSTFGAGSTDLGNETINNVPANSSICRSLYIDPNKPTGGGPLGYESCVYVTTKPYFRVYGGDITAGNGQPGACALVNNAAIVSWNKELAGSYGGAGVQFAALALHNIYDVATNLGNAPGTAATPKGLAFANTTASGSSIFGGKFGSFNNSCIPDYYGTPSGGSPGNNIDAGSLPNGTYKATGPLTINTSTFNGGKKVKIYVEGDVVINGNITYNGNWDAANIPLFQLIVKGNIYIASGVNTMTGVFIAQGATDGVIYTCASGATAISPTSSGYYATCNNRLVVNGTFIARQLQLLRTAGNVGSADAGDLNTSTNTAEVFNYGPAFWIPQPADTPTSGDYDSITSLPPIL